MRPPKNFHPEPFSYHQEIELTIDQLSNLGSGVGRVDGWVVFVPFTIPGEKIRARVWRNKKNYSDADLVEILESSPNRIEAECPLFGHCGGCQYQHLEYSQQLEWKTRQIKDLLKKMAGLDLPVNSCIGSPRTYGYRSKITPHFRRPPFSGVDIGFQRTSSRSIIDVEQCPIASDRINEVFPAERQNLRASAHKYKRGGTLLLRDTEDGVITNMKAVGREKIHDQTFEFIAGEFFQNNPFILPRLVDYALDRASEKGIRYLVDAYCGVGVFSICGHDRFEKLAGIEVSAAAVESAERNAAINGVENIEFILGKAEAIFEELSFPAQATSMIIDPPRRGCDEIFLKQLKSFSPKRLVYVSCGPDTQARDIKWLSENGYQIIEIQPFDLFPQTRHIENVITLDLKET